MKKTLLIIANLLTFIALFGQNSISGKIIDQSDKKPLSNASIILLNQDSILTTFTRTNEEGNFKINNIEKGNYIFIISYPKFELFSKNIDIQKNESLNTISLNSRENLIEEVIITHKLPIRLKGDTIEYNAASFETEKNAKLEDLLRRLPGMSVSGDGTITAQGKTVSKVLIDGEEFFGYDPKIAIRNVRADAVDKVQVYERKSEEAELTGIDDGQRFQTVNVVLKEEARKGIFGNTEIATGTDKLYTGNLFAAKFNRTERIGITANTNNMGGNGGRESDLRNNSEITGSPKNSSLGANYENQFLKKKLNVNGNYNYFNSNNNYEEKQYSKEIISPTQIQETDNISRYANTNQSHAFNSRIKLRIDSTSDLNFDFNARLAETTRATYTEQYLKDGEANQIRDYLSNNESIGNTNTNSIRINYRKRLNKRGRSINFHLNNNHDESTQNSLVDQTTYFYVNDSTSLINQIRISDSKSNNFNTQIQFSDRITSKLNYSIGYNLTSNISTNKLDAFDNLSATPIIDLNYSQNQKNDNLNQGIITNLTYNTEKFNINFSNRTSHKNQKLIDDYRSIDLNRKFWDNDLNGSLNYKITNRKNINLSYQNNYDIPSFGQLQPLQPQTNPIFIQEGNPNLKRANNNSFRINYNTISLLRGTSWNINSSISIKSDPIVNKRTIDENFITTSTYVNVDGRSSWNANINSNYNKPIFQKRIQFNVYSSANYTNGFSYIRFSNENIHSNNGQYNLANTENTSISTGIGLNEQDSKGLDFDFSWRVTLFNEQNNLQSNLNYTNLATRANGLIKYYLPHKFNITINALYNIEGPTKFYDKSITQFYTNLGVEKKLLKSNNLTASIKAYDIFKTYNNVRRSSSETNFSESTQEILTRYILIGLKWDFNKNLGKKKND